MLSAEVVKDKGRRNKDRNFQHHTNNLKFYNYDLKYDWKAGDFEIMIGTNSNDLKKATVNWVK